MVLHLYRQGSSYPLNLDYLRGLKKRSPVDNLSKRHSFPIATPLGKSSDAKRIRGQTLSQFDP